MTSAPEALGPGKRPSSWNHSHPDMAGQPQSFGRRYGGAGCEVAGQEALGCGSRARPSTAGAHTSAVSWHA
eukprot:647029-Alexandrium_andersonii.AAC.1